MNAKIGLVQKEDQKTYKKSSLKSMLSTTQTTFTKKAKCMA